MQSQPQCCIAVNRCAFACPVFVSCAAFTPCGCTCHEVNDAAALPQHCGELNSHILFT